MPRIVLPYAKGFGVEVEFNIPFNILEKHFQEHKGEYKFIDEQNIRSSLNNHCYFLKPDRASSWDWCGTITELNAGIYPLSAIGIDTFINHLSKTIQDLKQIKKKEFFNYLCGIHVHFSWNLFPSNKERINFIKLFLKYEPEIFQKCTHSDRMKNRYARPLKEDLAKNSLDVQSIDALTCMETGYRDHIWCLNKNHGTQTFEIRHLGSTTNIDSIKNWISLSHLFQKIANNEECSSIVEQSPTLVDLIKKSKSRNRKLIDWVNLNTKNKFSYDFEQED